MKLLIAVIMALLFVSMIAIKNNQTRIDELECRVGVKQCQETNV